MAEIRPLQKADLPAVARLLHANLTPDPAEEQISRDLQNRLIDDPWTDEELPSLVATEADEVVGFIAAQVRRFRLGDRSLRGVCCSDLTVSPGSRRGAAGALLLRRLLTMGQDITFSDTANADVARMWHTFGGHVDHARSCDWMVVLRPLHWARLLATDAILRRDLGRGQVPVGALPFQALRQHGGRWAFPEPQADVTGEDVDTAIIVDRLGELTRGRKLWVDYDKGFLDHLFGLAGSRFGEVTLRLVRRGDRALGWYAYVSNRSGVSRILHLLVGDREEDAEAVLADLVAHCREQGTAVLAGRHEPHLTQVLQPRFPVLGFSQRPVVHSHDAELLAILGTSSSVLTRLDGEWFVI